MDALFNECLTEIQNQLEVLPDKSEEQPELCLRALWALAQGEKVSALGAKNIPLMSLNLAQQEILRELIAQRLSGTPLAHITERQSFMSLELRATPAALIPRIETEILGRLALRCLADDKENPAPLVLDICTGSGNIALAVAHHWPQAFVHGSDLSTAAIELAQENSLLLNLQERVKFRAGDLAEPFRTPEFLQQVDLLICNPPYIQAANVPKMHKEIAEFEPCMAFDGGPLGIAIIDRMLKTAPDFLRANGWFCIEIGAGQGPFVEKRLLKSGLYHSLETACDHQGVIRAIRCKKNA